MSTNLFNPSDKRTYPSRWPMYRGKQLFREIDERSEEGLEELLSVSHITGVTPRSQKNVTMFQSESLKGYKLCKIGDIASNTMWTWQGAIGVSEYDGVISPAYNVYRQRDNYYNPRFLDMLLRERKLVDVYHSLSTGIRPSRLRLYPDDFLTITFPVPSKDEQEQIVRFLDWKVSGINKLINIRRREIKNLEELKEVIISDAVTKGLDKGAPMKDSGVSWIGEIPEDWVTVTIKHLADKNIDYPIGDGDHGLIKASDYLPEGIPYIRVLNLTWGEGLNRENLVYISDEMNEKIKSSTLRPNDLLVAKTGTVGKTAMVPEDMPISNTTAHVGKITVAPEYNARFLYYVLGSMVVRNQILMIASTQSTRPELGNEGVKNLIVTLPPRRVQDKIVLHLDALADKYTAMKYKLEDEIESLTELKTRLISDVVTGKIDVRDIEIPEYEYVGEEAGLSEDDIEDEETEETEETEEQED